MANLAIEGVGDVVGQKIRSHASFVWTKRLHDALREGLGILWFRSRSNCMFLDGLDESGHDAKPLINFVRESAK